MPYVEQPDRAPIFKALGPVVRNAVQDIKVNSDLFEVYVKTLVQLDEELEGLVKGLYLPESPEHHGAVFRLAKAIFEVSLRHKYDGAYLGELNYAVTQFIQLVPRKKVEIGDWNEEFRYWIYARTVSALNCVAHVLAGRAREACGVFEDVKDEYKRRVNSAYEAVQIIKNGDCFDTPYYTRLIEVVDNRGDHVGYQEVMLKRSKETVGENVLRGVFAIQKGQD
ncbi:MAG: hypothetical protein COV29_03450 [Candidatus Yanofskybacteria bacterium CG10_big_fil_rev_8_21_14_0_10_36_16]|uniref:Uncharacterized protein n=1 Tax=Candidatus Yanofskybacteria bacterium CG10_big_fil_rev_8_21_14_0_10_36_16 TaxID=1975096 RepID=A0A2J0Q725_9BACT|nr:MAG: hypothetical protein COV29_03450 [Candidatus Yanofskybacteria bacterium CG10_big_fil_rev_8_21_14_0_10_36_16]